MTRQRPFLRLAALIVVCAFCLWFWHGFLTFVFAATPAELRRAEQINQRINREGRDICWQYAFAKQAALNMPGRVTVDVVTDETGTSHAVVVLDGEWVLDNRFSWMQRKDSLIRFGYRWL